MRGAEFPAASVPGGTDGPGLLLYDQETNTKGDGMIEQLASLKEWVPVVIIMGGFAGIMRLMLAPIRVELQGIKDRLTHVEDTLKILPDIRERLARVEGPTP